MRNQFIDHRFLFDVHSVMGSTATPFGNSNVSLCGLWKFSGRNGVLQFWSFFPNLIALTKRDTQNLPTLSNLLWDLIWNMPFCQKMLFFISTIVSPCV